jgi:NCS1 family nucleobase:cation symporter-1
VAMLEEVRTAPEVRDGDYGTRVATVEPGGAEFIPISERHGGPLQLFWTWTSPNFEFATIFVGVIGIGFFGLSFAQSALAIVVGTLLGSLTLGLLSARGPQYGVPQMVLSRISFGYRGNILPAGLNAVTAGIGWFAVNSVSGAFALNALTHLPKLLCLVVVVLVQSTIAVFGHNLVQTFERFAFPVLAAAFILASVDILTKAHPSAVHGTGGVGGFLLTMGSCFGYAAGWNPYASDYTRYFSPTTPKAATAWWSAFGCAASCILLEVVGAASMTIVKGQQVGANPTSDFTGHMPTAIADITLAAIAVGAVSANALNIYSGSLSFAALGIRMPLKLRRALVTVVFGVIGFFVAWNGLSDAGSKYNNFLLVIAYWIGPWLAVVFTDQVLRRGQSVEVLLFAKTGRNWAGWVAMAIAMAISIPLFSNQTEYTGPIPKHHPAFGDFTFEAGFIIAAVVYAILFFATGQNRRGAGEPTRLAV